MNGTSPPSFTGRLLNNLEVRYEQWRRDGFAPIAAAWRDLAPMIGRHIRVQELGAIVEGTAIDIADDGALRLRRADGSEHRVWRATTVLAGTGDNKDTKTPRSPPGGCLCVFVSLW
jgi:BirA family biotin operon repressor/biotin-[acetyl-CoA-carboxylase] ligase